jgi:hypothetical protein
MPRKSKTAAEKLIEQEKRKTVLTLRKAGYSYREIQEQSGVSKSRAQHYVSDSLDQYREENKESTQELVEIENARLDAALRSIWPQVASGNLKAIDRFLKISDRRAKLLGLDAPTKRALTDADGNAITEFGALGALFSQGAA